jgi:flagellin
MALSINTNVSSLITQRNVNNSQSALATSLQRLSSGLRINSAKDDAAGFAVASGMDKEIRGMNVAIRNANDGISYAQTADSFLGEVQSNMQRMRELAVQAKSGSLTDTDRGKLDLEYQALAGEISRVAANSQYNGKDLFTAAAAAAPTNIQVGTGNGAGDTIGIAGMDLSGVAAANAFGSLTSTANATTAIDALDGALFGSGATPLVAGGIVGKRAELGAVQARFDSVISNLNGSVVALSASKSRITDTDFAAETANLSRGQILQQAGTAMLAQANSLPNSVLSLLRG